MNRSFAILAACTLVLTVGVLPGLGQETANRIIVQSYDIDVAGGPVPVLAFQNSAFPVPVSSFGWSGGGGDGMHLLNDPSVMKDLELVEDQQKQLNEVRKEFGKQLKEVMKEFGKAKNDQERIKQLQEEMQAIQKGQTDALSNVLLPHQLERIKQVSNQMQMNAMGTAGALQYGNLANELEISDDQKKKLLEIQQELQKEIAEKTNQLKEEAKKRVMEELTADQRAKLKSLTGEEFKRDPNDWQERFGKAPKIPKDFEARKKKSIKN